MKPISPRTCIFLRVKYMFRNPRSPVQRYDTLTAHTSPRHFRLGVCSKSVHVTRRQRCRHVHPTLELSSHSLVHWQGGVIFGATICGAGGLAANPWASPSASPRL